MAMTATERETTLSQWIKPSSEDEKGQQQRAERMVRAAITASEVLKAAKPVIYTKGSYPNNTNVRRDSDVDVVVELPSVIYYDYGAGVTPPPAAQAPAKYEGEWTPALWRSEIVKALKTAFNTDEEEHVTPGKIAINIDAVEGSRPSADVVPSFLYHRYDNTERTDIKVGSCVWSGSTKVVNWPTQQLENGQAKNILTPRYKRYVRALKNAENILVAAGTIELLPSYFMECLIYNVPNETLKGGTLAEGFGNTLGWMYQEIVNGNAAANWVEPNYMKWLFKGAQKWKTGDAQGLIQATWDYLGYGD